MTNTAAEPKTSQTARLINALVVVGLIALVVGIVVAYFGNDSASTARLTDEFSGNATDGTYPGSVAFAIGVVLAVLGGLSFVAGLILRYVKR